MQKYIIALLVPMLLACTDESDMASGVIGEADQALEMTQQAESFDKTRETMDVNVRLAVRLTSDGRVEVLNALETRGRGRLEKPVGEFVYTATVNGKPIAAGAFENPFIRRSAHHPETGYDLEIAPLDEAVVVLDLPGIDLAHPGFELDIERLTNDPRLKTINPENAIQLKQRGQSKFFGSLPQRQVVEALRLGRPGLL